MYVRLVSPLRWPLLIAGVVALIFALKTAGIEMLYQYNAHHMIRPSRIDPRTIAAPVPVRVLRVKASEEGSASTV